MGGRLLARTVERAGPGTHDDGDGLRLVVEPSGARSWVFRHQRHGTRRDMGLGGYPEVGLADARKRAAEARRLPAEGRDPLEEARKARAEPDPVPSFAELAQRVIADKARGWKSAKHAAQRQSTLEAYAFPVLGRTPIDEIETEHVLAVLRPLWPRAPETASRLRQRIETILAAAAALGYRDRRQIDPATWRGHLQALLPPPRRLRPVVHDPALPWREAPAFYSALCAEDTISAHAIRFAMLTAQRSGAVRLARWREIDRANGVWTCPPAPMKAGKAHRVPLTDEMLAVLEAVGPLARGPESPIFPGRSGEPLSDMALSMLVRGMSCDGLSAGEPPRWRDEHGKPIMVHGLRSTFRDWCRAHAVDEHVAELALAHVDKDKVRAAYARDDMREQRRSVMERWSRFCARKTAGS